MNPSIFLIVFAGYFAALAVYFVNFELQNESCYSTARRIVVVSLTAHLMLILWAFFSSNVFSLNSFSRYLDVVSFFMLLVCFLVEQKYKIRFLMLFALPIVLLFCFLAFLLERQTQSINADASGSTLLWVHTALILSAFTSFVVSVSSAIMYLLQSAQLKSKQLGRVFLKLPSLDLLDRLHFIFLFWGVLLFSLGILSGFLLARETQVFPAILKDPKVTLSFLTCLMYWIILSLRMSRMRRGQKIAAGTVVIFALLFMTMMSSFYAPSIFHKGI